MKTLALRLAAFALSLALIHGAAAFAAEPLWVVYDGFDGPGKGKHIVLVSGDEEYRSEEALPQLGKILARHHGFRCTVLFAIDPDHGNIINPNRVDNIPGLEALKSADLMIIATRFRALPDDQMRHIDNYLLSGRPVLGLRTANHGFRFKDSPQWAHYSFRYSGEKKAWAGGFGTLVFGDEFHNHHGWHKHESTRGLIAPGAEGHPITRGLKNGDVWGPTDVYGVKLPLPGDSRHIILGQVLEGMQPGDKPLGPGPHKNAPAGVTDKNDPMMPVAWTKTYQLPKGKPGRVFNTSMGASVDLTAAGTRRLIVNGAYWSLGLESQLPQAGAKVDLVGEFKPTMYQFLNTEHWLEKRLKPSDFAMITP